MKETKIAIILAIIGITLIVSGLVVGIIQASKEAYCNSLEIQEYLENRERCKDIIEK